MWTDILSVNAGPVADVIEGIVAELERTVTALRGLADPPSTSALVTRSSDVLEAGVEGQRRIPGKHGAAPAPVLEVSRDLADRPGELARLFTRGRTRPGSTSRTCASSTSSVVPAASWASSSGPRPASA